MEISSEPNVYLTFHREFTKKQTLNIELQNKYFTDMAFHIMVQHKQLQVPKNRSHHTEKRVKNYSNPLDNLQDPIEMP